MSTSRRLGSLLLVLLLIGAPAAALSLACAGAACEDAVAVTPEIPFCTLPDEARTLLAAGYSKGRSPEVFGVAAEPGLIQGGMGRSAPGAAAVWPDPGSSDPVGLLLWGEGVRTGVIDGEPGLRDVAPTLAAIAGFERGNEDVRTGRPIEGVWRPGRPRLLVMIGLKGTGRVPEQVERALPDHATLHARVGSLPIDSAASLTTTGTGGLPDEHGVTGSLLRSDDGSLVEAWSPEAHTPIIATLGDDLDERSGQRAVVGMVATDATDRGLIGGNWYLERDRDRFRVVPSSKIGGTFALELAAGGYGQDDVLDLLGATLEGSPRQMSQQMATIVTALRDMPVTIAMFGTGEAPTAEAAMTGEDVVSQVESSLGAPVVEAAIPGGLFLDRDQTTAAGVTAGKVMKALDAATVPGSSDPAMADSYAGFSVSFSRYCP